MLSLGPSIRELHCFPVIVIEPDSNLQGHPFPIFLLTSCWRYREVGPIERHHNLEVLITNFGSKKNPLYFFPRLYRRIQILMRRTRNSVVLDNMHRLRRHKQSDTQRVPLFLRTTHIFVRCRRARHTATPPLLNNQTFSFGSSNSLLPSSLQALPLGVTDICVSSASFNENRVRFSSKNANMVDLEWFLMVVCHIGIVRPRR